MKLKWIRSMIELINKDHQDMGIDNDTRFVYVNINLEDVSAFRQVIDDDMNINTEKTTLYMKSGDIFTIETPYKKIMELIQTGNIA